MTPRTPCGWEYTSTNFPLSNRCHRAYQLKLPIAISTYLSNIYFPSLYFWLCSNASICLGVKRMKKFHQLTKAFKGLPKRDKSCRAKLLASVALALKCICLQESTHIFPTNCLHAFVAVDVDNFMTAGGHQPFFRHACVLDAQFDAQQICRP